MRSGVSPLAMWGSHGITSFSRSSSVQAPLITYYNVAEGLEYQNPEVVIIGMIYLFQEYDVDHTDCEPGLRAVLIPAGFQNKSWKQLAPLFKKASFKPGSAITFFLCYGTIAGGASITENSFEQDHHYTRGQNTIYKLEIVEDQRNMTPAERPAAVDEDSAYYYGKAIEACLEKGCKVLRLMRRRGLTGPMRNIWPYSSWGRRVWRGLSGF